MGDSELTIMIVMAIFTLGLIIHIANATISDSKSQFQTQINGQPPLPYGRSL